MATVLAIASLALVIAVAALLLYAIVTRRSRWPALRGAWWDASPPPPPGDDGSGVREPRRPRPSAGRATALAEPDDRAA